MNEIKFTLRLTDGRWVSSPTNTATSNPNLAGVFTAADDEPAAELRQAMERIHGPLELVPWQSKRADALTRHVENVALMDEAQDPFAGAEVIYAYTRKDALADGMQVDVSETAREAELKFPVYLTRAVWESYVRVPDGVRCQDESGRLWDLVWMLRMAARRTSGPQMTFKLHVRNDNRDRTPPLVNLKAVCGARTSTTRARPSPCFFPMKTDTPIVLTIFGGERCVTTLADLEAAAKAIHQKAVRESGTSGHPSTLGAEIEGQIRVINAAPEAAGKELP